MTSKIEQAVLSAQNPLQVTPSEPIVVNGVKAIVLNRSETANFKDIDKYTLNDDQNPQVIKKTPTCCVNFKQEIGIRTLKPDFKVPTPGKIIIRQEADILLPPAPPLVVRQVNEKPQNLPPLIIRQEPPRPPPVIPEKVINVPGKQVLPPRKVVLEKLPPVPPKPQSIIIEKWLPYEKVKRKIILEKPCQQVEPPCPPKNVVVEWEEPCVNTTKDIKDLGVVNENPEEYKKRYNFNVRQSELPDFVLELEKDGIKLKKYHEEEDYVPELEGDIEALKLIDLDKEGLSEYKYLLNKLDS